MSVELDDKLVDHVVGQIKTQDDLADLSRQLLKAAIERVMAVELEDHLGIPSTLQKAITLETAATAIPRKPSKAILGKWTFKPQETAMVSSHLN